VATQELVHRNADQANHPVVLRNIVCGAGFELGKAIAPRKNANARCTRRACELGIVKSMLNHSVNVNGTFEAMYTWKTDHRNAMIKNVLFCQPTGVRPPVSICATDFIGRARLYVTVSHRTSPVILV
jgi:hypothetical protein